MSAITDFLPLWGKWYLNGDPIKKKGPQSSFLGEGSYGSVWRIYCEDESGIDYAAVKHISVPQNESEIDSLLSEGVISNEESAKSYYEHEVQMLRTEIATMRKLRGYTNIVSYEDDLFLSKEGGIGYDLFLRMELLKPLDKFASGIGEKEIVKLGIDIATAIDVINKHELVHRDIKPQNIFANSTGDYKLGDFGTARSVRSDATAMSVKGTYNYMAPEIFNRNEADNTVDIYSLGIVLYRLLNRNRLPFLPLDEGITLSSDMIEEAQAKRFSGKYEIPAPIDADPELANIVLKCCEYDPKRRWKTGEELRRTLINYQMRLENSEKNFDESKGDYTVAEKRESTTLKDHKVEIDVRIESQDRTVKEIPSSQSGNVPRQNSNMTDRISRFNPKTLIVGLILLAGIIIGSIVALENKNKSVLPIDSSITTQSDNSESGAPKSYTGITRNITFSMPTGWVQEERLLENGDTVVGLVSPENNKTVITYECKDIVKENGYAENMRVYFSSETLSETDLKGMLGEGLSGISKIERKNISGIEYYVVEGEGNFPDRSILLVENGYLHVFSLHEENNDNLQEDIDILYKIIESIKLP